jgi:hypothetical protein
MAGLRAMRRRRAERGVTVVQLAIAMPVVLLLIMAVIQYALFEFADQVAEAAATEGLQAATAYGVPDPGAAGQAAADSTVTSQDQLLLKPSTSVSVDLVHQTVTVVVMGTAMQLVPGLNLPVSKSAAGPIERLP